MRSTCARSRTRNGTCCPGPPSSRRSCAPYADYLGLDSRQLVEEYKQRFERPSTMELTPFAPRAGGRRARAPPRPRACSARGSLVVARARAAARRALRARAAGATTGRPAASTTAATPTATPAQDQGQEAQEARGADACHASRSCPPGSSASASWTRAGKTLINSQDAAGRRATRALPRQALPRHVRQRPARMRIKAGKRTIDVPDRSTPVGYDVRPGKRPRELPTARRPDLLVSARAGIVVTGTEVLSGIISDRNGPWLSERLREHGIELAADRDRRRPAARTCARRCDFMAARARPGGHERRPRADRRRPDRRGRGGVQPGARWRSTRRSRSGSGRILERLRSRWRNLDEDAIRASNRKQALVPDGATVLEPVGTAPGLVVPPPRAAPTVLVLPGPPRELQPMWETALETPPMRRAARAARAPTSSGSCACSGSRSRRSRARCARSRPTASPIEQLEITTCLRRGEIEIATVFEPPAAARLRRVRGGDPRAPRRHAVLRGRLDGRRPGDRAARPGRDRWRWPSRAPAG